MQLLFVENMQLLFVENIQLLFFQLTLFVFAFQKCIWKNLKFFLFFSLLQINMF